MNSTWKIGEIKNSRKKCLFVIYCDFGNPQKKLIIRRSYSKKSAETSWKKFYKNFSQNKWRCWQENEKGCIINDSNAIDVNRKTN